MDPQVFIQRVVVMVLRALIEGLAVAVAAVFIAKRSLPVGDVMKVALTAAVVFLVLDSNLLSPVYGLSARQGAGFGMGANLVGFPMGR
jgi:hypothetical protein